MKTSKDVLESLSVDIRKPKKGEESKFLGRLFRNEDGKGGPRDYLKIAGVVMAVNDAFGTLEWDLDVKKVKVVLPPFRITKTGLSDAVAGTLWNAVAYAKVRLICRFKDEDGQIRKVKRDGVAAAGAVGGKALTAGEAMNAACTSAVSFAVKNAAKWFGSTTGLTLAFEPHDRDHMQRWLEYMNEGSEVEDTSEPADLGGTPEPETKAAEVQAPAPASKVPLPLRRFVPQVLETVWRDTKDGEPIDRAHVFAFHNALKALFGQQAVVQLWGLTGAIVTGKEVKVTKQHFEKIAQIFEEANAGPGIDAFFKSLVPAEQPAPAPAPATAPAQPASEVAALKKDTPAQPAQEVAATSPGINDCYTAEEHKQIDKAFVGTEKPAAPVATAPEHDGTADLYEAFLITIQRDEAKIREHFTKKFGTGHKELVDALVSVSDTEQFPTKIASALHSIGIESLKRVEQSPVQIHDYWMQAGVNLRTRKPTGLEARRFAYILPE